MHRPRAALLVAVAVAAACLSSPPAPRAAVRSVGTDHALNFEHSRARPHGDSDQFTTKVPPPPSPTQITPVPSTGGTGGGSRFPGTRLESCRVRVTQDSGLEQLLKYLFRFFSGIAEQ
jgi:hypothetical protein